MTSTFWKGQVLSNRATFGPFTFMIPLSSLISDWFGVWSSVNVIETPRTCGHGVIASEERPVIQQRGKKDAFCPK